MNFNPLFDATAVDTPAGMTPALILADISGVPAAGTGLAGAAFVSTDRGIWSIERFEEVISESAPVLTFTSTELNYRGFDSANSIADFLGDDAASISGGDGDAFEMGPSGFVLTGYVYIPPGTHEINVNSDDGFTLAIGGVPFSEFLTGRGPDDTTRVAEFDGGLYQIDMLYFDGGGGHALKLEIDGLLVDQSAFYLDPADFQNPPADVPIVPVEDYHPSYFLEDTLDIATEQAATEGHDNIQGLGAAETIDGLGGDDIIRGGYGNDSLAGGDGDDLLDGERGSDIVFGGAGDDLLIARSDGGEQRIGQLALGTPTRPDSPEGEVNPDREKLFGYEGQPLVGDDILFGGEGRDTFLISPLLNGKLDIIEKHVRSDGSIRWAGVAGENTYLHDHWPDMNGIEVIGDYTAGEDTIAVIGHTANVYVEYRDTDGDGDEESIITIISNQGSGGGAHDDDLLGFAIVHGDRVEQDDIITDAGVTYGIVENYADVAEAIFPQGDLKVTVIDGETVYGYDTRDALGNLGPITGSPEDFIDNPYLSGVTFSDPSVEDGVNLTRDPFDQLGFTEITGQTQTGSPGADELRPTLAADTGLPGALGYYSFTDSDGSYEDARGGPAAKAYTLYESMAVLRTDGLTTGPDGVTQNAIEFNGEDEFVHIQHDVATNVTQGTIALWVRPDDLSEFSTMVSKDQSGAGDGGHFRLSHTEDGALFLRFATGDGGGNRAWQTASPQLTEGEWSHLAVSYGADGITVYVDGKAIPDFVWYRVDGNVETPGIYQEAYMISNDEAWVLGADTFISKGSATAAEFAVNDDDLRKPFDGAIAEFGIWGGFTAEDILTKGEINELIDNGPGAALTNPSGPQPMTSGDDLFQGGDGDDMIFGEAGDDTLEGGDGDDSIEGGYGDDSINGGDGDDVLDGGRGSDLVIGGLGDDVLYSRSDAGEQRLGQLVLGEPSRPDDNSIDYDYLKLVDWVDQPLIADDVFVGGEGGDLFYFEPLLNAKKDIILEHVREDRTINWAGVAGENTYLHDHWVDQFGIDIIADYDASEDTIAVIGHTANILDVTYQSVDTDGDGINDSVASLIQVYSQQGDGGGAHDEDLLGMIVAFGDVVNEDDIVTNPGVTPGIVRTVDELQEALAPTGETKITVTEDGVTLFGYDSRDVEGDPLGTDPLSFTDNPFFNNGDVTIQNQLEALGTPGITLENAGGTFDGNDDFIEIPHDPTLALVEGTYAFSFNANTPGDGNQTLLSKDHSGLKDGGHLTMWINGENRVEVRIQTTDRSIHLRSDKEAVETGEEMLVAFTFGPDGTALYLNGELVDTDIGVPEGMLNNAEDLVLGASTANRFDDKDRLKEFFDGSISDLAVFDRALEPVEVILLAEAGGGASTIGNPPPEPGIVGDDGDNRLLGTAEDDVISGAGGDDNINGRAGADIMIGGTGNDRFYCDDENDEVIEYAGGGYDRVYSSISATLSANVEAIHATGSANIDLTGNAEANWMDGNAAANILLGGDGNDRLRGKDGDDVLDGEGGNDFLEGGAGADIFRVGPDGGIDTVLDFEQGVDRIDLTPTGTSPTAVTITDSAHGARIAYDDNNPSNILIVKGVFAADLEISDFVHDAGATTFMVEGSDSNDVLDGRGEAALLMGGDGDDRYYVDALDDQIIEGIGAGYDRVYASGDHVLSDHIEAIAAHGSGSRALTGNDQNNWVTGGASADSLLGEGGNDRIQGRDGNDLIDGGKGNDILKGGAGLDRFRFDLGDGSDVIQDFTLGADLIDLSDTGKSFSDLTIYDSANGAVVRYDMTSGEAPSLVVLNGLTAAQIDEDSFVF